MKTLKKNILSYFLLFSILPLLIASGVILSNTYIEKKQSIYHQHLGILHQINAEITSFTEHVEHISKYLKDKYSLKQYDTTKELTKIEDNIVSILILSKDGIIDEYVSEIETNVYKGFDYSNKKFYQEIANGKDVYWSEVFLSSTTNKPAISYSFKIDNNQIGVFIIDLSSLNEYIKKFQSVDESNFYVARVTDKNGVMIIHPDFAEYIAQRKSIANTEVFKKYIKKDFSNKQIEFYGLGKGRSIGVYGVNEKLGWNIIVKDRVEFIFKTFYSLMTWIIIFLGVLIAILIYFSFKFSKTIIEPLEEVSKNMGEVALGVHSKTISSSQYDELNTLVSNFTIMQKNVYDREEQLKNFNEMLEDKVEDKTKELKELNESLEEKIKVEISKNQQKEKMLFEQSKMASMGEMIGNIAHQWRQPLSVISTTASGMKVHKEFGNLDDKKFAESIESIVKVTKHLSQTIDDFRNFFMNSKDKTEFSIKGVIEKNLVLMDSAFKDNGIKVFVNFQKDSNIFGYENELTQAILNILNNAKDALKSVNNDEKYIFINGFNTPKFFILSIRDNGGGIKPEIISKVFEPYFTTKHKSQGTGIGLYMTRQIINDHMKGSIEVLNSKYAYDEDEYIGAEFVITLPLNQ